MAIDKKVALLGILGVLAAASLIYGIITPSKVKRENAGHNVPSDAPGASSGSSEGLAGLPVDRVALKSAYTGWGRNPFSEEKQAAETVPVLIGIAWDEKTPTAVINDRILASGDWLDSRYQIKEIKPDRVILSDGARDVELRLGQKK